MQTSDVAFAEEWKFDHGVMVPLHFLTPEFKTPVIPVNINCQGPPLTPLARAWAFGEALRRACDEVPERIALVGTGGISHWPATPDSGKINEAWDRDFLGKWARNDRDALLAYTDEETYRDAGQGGFEIRTFIATAAAARGQGDVWFYAPHSHLRGGLYGGRDGRGSLAAMPNIVVEYTANIRAEADIPGLLKAISRTIQAAGQGAFAVAAVRVRAVCCEDYVIGDDDPDYAFVLINARLAKGRPEEDKRRTFDAVWKAVQAHLAPVSASRMLAISMDVRSSATAWPTRTTPCTPASAPSRSPRR